MDFNREFSVGLLVLVGIYAGIYLNSDYFDVFTASFVDLRSEYTAVEQLSKFGLILSMLACLYSFHFHRSTYTLKATASLFALLLTIYLSESNMIREKYQPVFGGILIIATAYWLLRAKEFVVLVLFCMGIGIASSGSLHDFLQESESFLALVPSSITSFILSFNEESIDTLGIGVICLSVAFLAPQPLSKLVDKGWGYFFLVVIAASLVAIGNGLAHYQYDPSTELLIVSSLLSLMGLSIYYILDNAVKDEHFKHVVENKKILYVATIYLFFVLPILWADYNNFTAVSFWLLSIYLGKKMYEKSLKAI